MMLMELDNGVFASYQQCHYAPDGWRNYTIIGTQGRVENFGEVVKLWDRRTDYNPEGDAEFRTGGHYGGHGGADPSIVAEFVRYVRDGGAIATSPIAARHAVAAGYLAAHSLRNGNVPMEVPALPKEIVAYFEAEVAGR